MRNAYFIAATGSPVNFPIHFFGQKRQLFRAISSKRMSRARSGAAYPCQSLRKWQMKKPLLRENVTPAAQDDPGNIHSTGRICRSNCGICPILPLYPTLPDTVF